MIRTSFEVILMPVLSRGDAMRDTQSPLDHYPESMRAEGRAWVNEGKPTEPMLAEDERNHQPEHLEDEGKRESRGEEGGAWEVGEWKKSTLKYPYPGWRTGKFDTMQR
jgi:hypothetical protein